jgi:sugar lactone lactonase YvrE
MPKLLDIIETHDILGEGPLWNAVDRRLWWTDIHGRRLRRFDPETRVVETTNLPERLGSFAFLEGEEGRILAAFASGPAYFDVRTGRLDWIARCEAPAAGRRFNDGRTDRQGRFWLASMVEDEALAGAASAGLFCLGHDGRFLCHRGDVQIGNGLCVSPDGKTLYFADSPRRIIHAFDLESATGVLSGARCFALVDEGYPDGAAMDSEGHLWSARWGAGQVVRHAPDGTVSLTLQVPVSQPSCVAFGGADMRLMFVTSAKEGLSPEDLARDRLAGSLLVYQTEVAGLLDRRYAAPA